MIDTSAFQGKRAAYYTLGCKLNFSETSTFGRMLSDMGVVTAGENESADICIINTCSVTDVAEHKCRQAIRRMINKHPNAFVIVTGCYAQLSPNTISKIDGVDLIIGSNEKAQLIDFLNNAWQKDKTTPYVHTVSTKEIKSFAPSCERGDRTRYFLKVQDGCDYFCTYCTIPFARGFSRSPSIESLVKQVRKAAEEGGKEIVLTGVNIGHFGAHTSETFLDLVKELDKIEEIKRYRISSLEPDLIDDKLIEYCSTSRAFMPHFHIPLQSGSDHVLELMHRRYDTTLFRHKVNLIKHLIPSAFIGVDVMVGTRGEQPEHFEETFQFLSSLDISQLHVFPYSERPGTAALKIPYIVDELEKKRRSNILIKLSEEKNQNFYAKHIGQNAEVLFEKSRRGRSMNGFTKNYIRVELPASEAREEYDNQLKIVSLEGFNNNKTALKAKIIKN